MTFSCVCERGRSFFSPFHALSRNTALVSGISLPPFFLFGRMKINTTLKGGPKRVETKQKSCRWGVVGLGHEMGHGWGCWLKKKLADNLKIYFLNMDFTF